MNANTPTTTSRYGYLLTLLFFANFLNFFDRALPAVVLEPIRIEFGLSDTLLGALGTAFVLVYAIAGIPLGRLADRYRRLSVLAVGLTVWSVLTAATGATKNFVTLTLMRLGVGVGEACCAPAANSLLGDMYPSDRRSRPVGLFMLGLPLGTLAAFAFGGWLAQQYGWRAPFFFAAVPGLIVAVLLWRAREPLRGASEQDAAAATVQIDRPIRRLLSIPTLRWLIVSGATMNFAAYAINTFLPAMLVRYHGLGTAAAGGVSAIVLGLTGIIGLVLGGMLADRAHRRWPRGRLLLGAASIAAAVPLLWLGLLQPVGATTALVLLLSAGWLLVFLYYVTVYPAIQDIVPPQLRATGMAVYFFFMYVLGGGLGSFATGALSDAFAASAMQAAGAQEMSTAFRAVGLRDALLWILPTALALTALAILMSARSYQKDAQGWRNAPAGYAEK
ncbi:MAG TPA: MFS transporter [Solimonas sp.]